MFLPLRIVRCYVMKGNNRVSAENQIVIIMCIFRNSLRKHAFNK